METIALLPSPGMGHLIPLLEFAKRLVLHHNFTVTFTIPTDGSPSDAQKSVLDDLPLGVNSVFLPPVNFDDLSDDVKIETRISLTVLRSLPSLRDVFKALLSERTHLVALVVDLFGSDALDVAREFKIPAFIFFPSTCMALSLVLHLPKLDQTVSCEYRDLPEPLKLPGCVPLQGRDLFDPIQDRKNQAYSWFLHHAKRFKTADAIIVNSFMDLEPGALKALKEEETALPPVFPIGPLVRTGSPGGGAADAPECLRWLDHQPPGSVLFVSFGSGGTLSNDQMNELALGLEMSERRFLWVVRSPSGKAANPTIFFGDRDSSRKDEPFEFLPRGFLQRTKERGLVVPSWAPQAQVLGHVSTGGFLTHCGWNSTLESVVHGVPLIAWPLYAEQKMNAVMLTEDLKVALRPKVNEAGVVVSDEITKVVKALMGGEEGEMIRIRMNDLKEAAAEALRENGSSAKSLSEVVQKWRNQTPN